MSARFYSLSRFRRSTRVDETRVGDRVVVYNRDSGSGVVLNPTGSLIWDSLATPRSSDELVQELVSRFPRAGTDRISKDVNGYVESLLQHNLIASE